MFGEQLRLENSYWRIATGEQPLENSYWRIATGIATSREQPNSHVYRTATREQLCLENSYIWRVRTLCLIAISGVAMSRAVISGE